MLLKCYFKSTKFYRSEIMNKFCDPTYCILIRGVNWSFGSIREFKIYDDSNNATNFAYLMNKNKTFARHSRGFILSVHFFPVRDKCAT